MAITIKLAHAFAAAHRLPQLGAGSKCANLHGHTWHTTLHLTGPVGGDGTIVEFGPVKTAWRAMLDALLDHGAMLGHADPLTMSLLELGCKVHVFGGELASQAAHGLDWPTVENVAVLLSRLAASIPLPAHVTVAGVDVAETPVNSIDWRP